jgi:hypothetical protein
VPAASDPGLQGVRRSLARAGIAEDDRHCSLELADLSARRSLLCTEPVTGRTALAVALEAAARGIEVEAA